MILDVVVSSVLTPSFEKGFFFPYLKNKSSSLVPSIQDYTFSFQGYNFSLLYHISSIGPVLEASMLSLLGGCCNA